MLASLRQRNKKKTEFEERGNGEKMRTSVGNRLRTLVVASVVLAMNILPAGAITGEVGLSGTDGSVPVEVTAAAATFAVTIPTSLPIHVSADGVVTVANDASINNQSAGPVKVTSVAVTGENGWSIVSPDTDYTSSEVDLKQVGLTLNGGKTTADGIYTLQSDQWPNIESGTSLAVVYSASVSPQSQALTQRIASVVFTLDWVQAPDSGGTSGGGSSGGGGAAGGSGGDSDSGGGTSGGGSDSGDISNEPLTIDTSGKITGLTAAGVLALDAGVGELIIPSSINGVQVTGIGDGAFTSSESIRSVTIPAGVTSIGAQAFMSCVNLENVTFASGSSLVSIGAQAFSGCTKLHLELPSGGNISIADTAFEGIASIKYRETPNAGAYSLDGKTWGATTRLATRLERNGGAPLTDDRLNTDSYYVECIVATDGSGVVEWAHTGPFGVHVYDNGRRAVYNIRDGAEGSTGTFVFTGSSDGLEIRYTLNIEEDTYVPPVEYSNSSEPLSNS